MRTTRPRVVWTPADDGAFHQCLRPACDPGPAEPAPTTTCADGRLRSYPSGGELHIYVTGDRCADPFGVIDIDFGADACSPDPSRCAGQRTARIFRQAIGERWVDIYQHPYGGCGEVIAVRPDFPATLCHDLPPLPGATYWGG